jgi:hypothetical protein
VEEWVKEGGEREVESREEGKEMIKEGGEGAEIEN